MELTNRRKDHKNWRWIALNAALASTVVVTACSSGGGAPANTSEGNAAAGTDGGTAATPAAEEKPFELSIMTVLHTPELPSDKVLDVIEEKTNTKLNINWVPNAVYEEKVLSSMATDSMPQAIYVGNIAIYNNFKSSLRAGQFWEIGPYLDQFPYLKNLDPVVLKNSAVDGKIYGLYQATPLSRQGVIYRKDWADKLGLKAPETIDDLYAMMKAFAEQDPDGDGQKNTIGLADRSDLVYGAFKTTSSYFGTPNNWGELDGELRPEFMFPAYMDTMNFFRKLFQEGLINHDFPVTSKPDHEALFKTGKAGTFIGCICAAPGYQRDMEKTIPGVKLDVANRIKGPNGEVGVWSVPGYGNMVLFPKSSIKNEEELKKVLSFFDQLMNPEIYNLLNYGIEGDHYEIVNGQAKGFTEEEKVAARDRDVRPLLSLRIGGPETVDGLVGYEETELHKKTNAAMADNNNILITDPAAAYDSPTRDQMGVQLQQIITDATYKYILGDIDEAGFQSAIDKWLKDGGQKIVEEINEQHRVAGNS
ncbi:extracellular solute-binding protein [Paenibacillus sp.]|uniref:extracellular solute-binding protein n=1 Tax=Paenibacillus sp. TaxID=58172 RepID=UPI002D5DE588|nr:extracellular solute-binding protein [Paenibacillus sp.]HZG86248.1 extracellular solute-binding protein [Paenibacillus sp.]